LYKESEHSPLQFTNQLKGYYNINPLMSLSLAISIFSLAGIPPLIGFFAKQSVLLSALLNGYYFLSIVAVLTSVIGGVYYLGLIKYIYFDEEENLLNEKNIKIYIPSSWAGIISIITLGILLFIIDPIILLSNANILGLGLGFNLGVDGICIPSNLSYLVPLIFNKSKLTIRKPILIWLCTVTVGSIVKILNVLGINGLTLTLKGKAPLGNIDLSKLSIANENKKKNMNIYSYIFKYYLIRFNYWGVPLELINRNTLASSVGTMVINIIFIPILSFILLGLNLLLGPHNPQNFFLGDLLSNSGKVFKLIIPNYILNYLSGWSNYSCKVTIYKIYESIIGNRGSKLAKFLLKKSNELTVVVMKNFISLLRWTLVGSESSSKLNFFS